MTTSELLKLQDETEKQVRRYSNFQLAKKVTLNSAYGSLANPYFRFSDWRLSSAITVSGQLTTQWIIRDVNLFLNEKSGTTDVDYIVAGDTDSIYLRLDSLIEHQKMEGKTLNDTKKNVEDFCNGELSKFIAERFAALAVHMNAYENTMKMKLESVCNRAIWKAKKMYILNVLSSEGVDYDPPDIKMKGIETIRSTTPQVAKDALTHAIWLCLNKTEFDVQSYIKEVRQSFDKFTFEEMAFPRGVNGVSKYSIGDDCAKGTPIHVRAAITYNRVLKNLKLEDRYPLIYDGSKIKFAHLIMPNPYHSPVIAVARNMPPQFEIDKHINRQLQFEKTFLEPLRHILDVIGWEPEKTSTLEGFFE